MRTNNTIFFLRGLQIDHHFHTENQAEIDDRLGYYSLFGITSCNRVYIAKLLAQQHSMKRKHSVGGVN